MGARRGHVVRSRAAGRDWRDGGIGMFGTFGAPAREFRELPIWLPRWGASQRGIRWTCSRGYRAGRASARGFCGLLVWMLRWDAVSGGSVGLADTDALLRRCQRGDSVGCLYGCCAGMLSAGVPLNWLAWLLRWDAISEGFAGLAHMVAALGGCQRGDSADCPYGCFAEVASVCRRRHADASQPAWDPHRGVCVGNRVESAIRGRRYV